MTDQPSVLLRLAAIAMAVSPCVAGIASTPLVAADAPASHQLEVERIETRVVGNGLQVRGLVRRSPGQFGVLTGKLRVSASDASGQGVVVRDVRWSTMPLTGPRLATFSVVLPSDRPSQLTSVRAQFVPATR